MHAKEANNARDALAKTIYVRLFNDIVKKVNKCMPLLDNNTSLYIGVLDTAGFGKQPSLIYSLIILIIEYLKKKKKDEEFPWK